MRLHLIDQNDDLVVAWTKAFSAFGDVTVQQGDLLAAAKHCIVSPANSYGFMDGGIDAAYRAFFGAQIERKVQDAVTSRPEGHLPVGASLVVRTGHPQIPFLIVAPTMVTPEEVTSRNSYRAMAAVLRMAMQYPEVATDVFCPGLATGVGMVPPENAAVMMAEAYRDWNRLR
jgi:O-acetyl-ADP-ribose deacetylase (regulator of RNase III)